MAEKQAVALVMVEVMAASLPELVLAQLRVEMAVPRPVVASTVEVQRLGARLALPSVLVGLQLLVLVPVEAMVAVLRVVRSPEDPETRLSSSSLTR